MSYVCNVVLLMGVMEERGDTVPALDFINAWLEEDGQGRLHRADQYGTNRKVMEVTVALGAFNYLDVEGLLSTFQSAPWEDPESVQLLIRNQDDDLFIEHRVTPNRGEG